MITTIMDWEKCPHIPLRLFPFLRYFNTELKAYFQDKGNSKKINDKLIQIMQILWRLHEHMEFAYQEINNTLIELDEELWKWLSPSKFNDNSGKVQTIFADFILTGNRVFKHLAVLFWLIIEQDKITSLNKMMNYLNASKDKNVIDMLESDKIRWKNLTDFRNAVEHIEWETMKYLGYEIIHEKWKLPLIETPRFKYGVESAIAIRDYLYPTYINIFTFIEDILAIATNIRIGKSPIRLIKVKKGDNLDDNDIFILSIPDMAKVLASYPDKKQIDT